MCLGLDYIIPAERFSKSRLLSFVFTWDSSCVTKWGRGKCNDYETRENHELEALKSIDILLF